MAQLEIRSIGRLKSKMRYLRLIISRAMSRPLRRTPYPTRPRTIAFMRPRDGSHHANIEYGNTDSTTAPRKGVMYHYDYNSHDCAEGICIFNAGNTFFRVHKCYLSREPSAFRDMFDLPAVEESTDGQTTSTAILLSDTSEQFQDLLWALTATRTQLIRYRDEASIPLQRLLNIALLANKYCMASCENWAIECIVQLARGPCGFFRFECADICAQALDIAALCDCTELLGMATHHLVTRMLWSDFDRQPVLGVAECRGIDKLRGVAYYRNIVDLEHQNPSSNIETSSTDHFLSNIHARTHLSFLSAYRSIVALWDRIRREPPTLLGASNSFGEASCPSHNECIDTWRRLWFNAAASPRTSQIGPANVLGKLESMMMHFEEEIAKGDNYMSIECCMAALESVIVVRDEVVNGLITHFQS